MELKKNALITGISGSGGSYLAEYMVNNQPNVEVHGISRWHSDNTPSSKNLEAIADKIQIHEGDLTDFSSVFRILKEVKPDYIFHLASYANVGRSFDNPLLVFQNNVGGTANLFEAIRCAGIDPIIQLCSTSEVYGDVDPKYVPIKEDCPINPVNPYSVSKVFQDCWGNVYSRSFGLKIIRTRMFSYINPRREDLFATAFAKQIARIEQGLQKELIHGNLESIRTLIDVRDAMESYWIATIKCEPGEVYNIGGTEPIKVGEFLEILKKKAKQKIPSRMAPSLIRPTDITNQIPCIDKFVNKTGWKPKYNLEESTDYLLDYWRKEVAKTRQLCSSA